MFEDIANEALQMLIVMFWLFLTVIIIYGATWIYAHKRVKSNL